MKMTHDTSWFSKYPDEKFGIEYSFSGDLDASPVETINSASVTITDSSGTDRSASMISSVATNPSYVTFTVDAGTAGETYTIKVLSNSSGSNKFIHYVTCEVFGALTLNTKLGDIGANSYATLKEANDYIRNKYGHDSVWDSLDDEGKKRVLIQAASDLEVFNYNGAKYYEAQALEFPRSDHTIITGNPATPLSSTGFKNTSLYSTTYGVYPTDFWKYGAVHITSATPANDVRVINTSNSSTGAITVDTNFTATPVESADFIIFKPLDAEVKNAQCEQAIFIIQNSRVDSLQNYKELGARAVQIGDTSIEFAPGGGDRIAISSKARKLLSRWVRKTLRVARS